MSGSKKRKMSFGGKPGPHKKLKLMSGDEATELLRSGQSVHLRKSGHGGLVTKGRDRSLHVDFKSIEIAKNKQLGQIAFGRGASNIRRLAKADHTVLDSEIEQLETLRGHLRSHIVDTWGATGKGLAKEWEKKGRQLAQTGSTKNYRSSRTGKFSVTDNSSGTVHDFNATGWDEVIQTAIARNRAKGRISALGKVKDKQTRARLDRIHELMSVTSSLARLHTGGVASSHNVDDSTFSSHSTSTAYGVGGVGSNPMGHRLRTEQMQREERRITKSDPDASMAERQMARLRGALTTSELVMTSPFTVNTNQLLIGRASQPASKRAAMWFSREREIKPLRTGLRELGRTSKYQPSFFAPPSPKRD